MGNIIEEKWYTLKDLNRAFNMGLESAVYVLESSQELTPNGVELLIKSLKEMISKAPEGERRRLS